MVKVKIGLLMESIYSDRYIYDLVNDLGNNSNIELFLLLHASGSQNINLSGTSLSHHPKKINSLDYLIVKWLENFESIILQLFFRNESYQHHLDIKCNIKDSFLNTISINPSILISEKSDYGSFISYDEEDIKKIQALELDLIIKGTIKGELQGGILTSSKKGILSLEMSDIRWNRGKPVGFWEVYYKKASTGFTIKLQKENDSGYDIIFRGDFPTTSIYFTNQVNIFSHSFYFFKKIIQNFSYTGTFPPAIDNVPFYNQIYSIPSKSVIFRYFLSLCNLFTYFFIQKAILNKHIRFSVAFLRTNWRNANLSKAIIINNPKGRFFADPFAKKIGEEVVIFVEDYDYTLKKGIISAIRIRPDETYEILPGIIKEDFHLSFPYIFEYQNDLYMIPESGEARSIRLYKCIHFPDKWEYQHNVLENVDCVDSIIFEFSGKWWLLTNISFGNWSPQLYAFVSDNPISQNWTPHHNNPICFSTEYGRNGGILKEGNMVYRVRQKLGFGAYGTGYGAGLSIARIDTLDMDHFHEEQVCIVEPHFISRLKGIHHMHFDEGITVFDFIKEERYSK